MLLDLFIMNEVYGIKRQKVTFVRTFFFTKFYSHGINYWIQYNLTSILFLFKLCFSSIVFMYVLSLYMYLYPYFFFVKPVQSARTLFSYSSQSVPRFLKCFDLDDIFCRAFNLVNTQRYFWQIFKFCHLYFRVAPPLKFLVSL